MTNDKNDPTGDSTDPQPDAATEADDPADKTRARELMGDLSEKTPTNPDTTEPLD